MADHKAWCLRIYITVMPEVAMAVALITAWLSTQHASPLGVTPARLYLPDQSLDINHISSLIIALADT